MDFQSIVQKFFPKKKEGDTKKGEQGGTSEQVEATAPQDPADVLMLKKILDNLSSINKESADKFIAVENRVTALESKFEDHTELTQLSERIAKVEASLNQFTKVYELITSQYNPFVDEKDKMGGMNSPMPSMQKPAEIQETPVEEPVVSQPEVKEEAQVSPEPAPVPKTEVPAPVQEQKAPQVELNVSVTEQKPVDPHVLDNLTPKPTLHLPNQTTQTAMQNESDAKSATGMKYSQKTTDFYVSGEQAFVTQSGTQIHSLLELLEALYHMDDEEYAHFVSPNKNDFASWVHNVLKNDTLAKEMFECNSKDDLLYLLADLV